jgi:HK97 family phage portal protein
MRGNAYARIYRDGRGGARELRILHPNFVRPFMHKGSLYYEVQPNPAMGDTFTSAIILTSQEILHVKNMSSDGLLGRSPIQVHRDTIGIGLSNRNFVSDIHKNGGRVRGALTHPGKLDAEQVNNLRTGFVSAINEGRFPMLQNGVDFKALSLTPADAEYIRTHNLTAIDICSIYGVPPHKIAILDRATFSNIEHQGIEYVQETLLPIVKNWEPELKRKLLPQDLKKNHHYRFNLEGRMRGDTISRMRAYAIARQWGWLSADEIRELENMNPLPDSQG